MTFLETFLCHHVEDAGTVKGRCSNMGKESQVWMGQRYCNRSTGTIDNLIKTYSKLRHITTTSITECPVEVNSNAETTSEFGF